MDLTNRVDVHLEPDEHDRLKAHEPIQIPIGNRVIVVIPPREDTDSDHGESETLDSVGDGDTVDELTPEQ